MRLFLLMLLAVAGFSLSAREGVPEEERPGAGGSRRRKVLSGTGRRSGVRRSVSRMRRLISGPTSGSRFPSPVSGGVWRSLPESSDGSPERPPQEDGRDSFSLSSGRKTEAKSISAHLSGRRIPNGGSSCFPL